MVKDDVEKGRSLSPPIDRRQDYLHSTKAYVLLVDTYGKVRCLTVATRSWAGQDSKVRKSADTRIIKYYE